jgi:hypothetical protein
MLLPLRIFVPKTSQEFLIVSSPTKNSHIDELHRNPLKPKIVRTTRWSSAIEDGFPLVLHNFLEIFIGAYQFIQLAIGPLSYT